MRNDNNFTLLANRDTITKKTSFQSTLGRRKVRAGLVLNKQLREVQLFVMNMACLLLTFSTFEDSYQKKRRKREGSHSPAAATALTTHWGEDLTPAGIVISSFELWRNAMHQNHAFLLSQFVGALLILKD